MAEHGFEIISADSVQVYRYLDIGSGKPSAAQRKKVLHHLIDIIDPDLNFSAGDFCREAIKAADKISHRGNLPLFVGGTGLYIDAFFKGLSEIPVISSPVKARLKEELNTGGLQPLYEELCRCDPIFAEKIHHNDRQRILRGLEVYRETGRPLSGYFGSKEGHESDNTLYIGLRTEKQDLYKKIDTRVDTMISEGLVDEVVRLRGMGYGPGLNSMKSIGYAECNEYLDGDLSLEKAVEKIKIQTKRYAKRQMTWFRKNPRIYWYNVFDLEKIMNLVYSWRNSL